MVWWSVCVCVCVCERERERERESSVVSHSLLSHGLWLLCPWNSPGKNSVVGCHFFLQGIFLTQGLNPHLLRWQADSLPLSHLGIP